MKWATLLFVLVMAAAAGTIYWVMSALRRPGSPAPTEQTLAPPEPETKPVRVPPPPAIHVEPVSEPDEITAAAAAASAPPPPEVKINPAPPLPFPRLDQIKIGANRDDLLHTYQEPAVRSITNVHGDLVETYVYKNGTSPDTWVIFRNGEVAAKFTAAPIPKQRQGATAPRAPVRPATVP